MADELAERRRLRSLPTGSTTHDEGDLDVIAEDLAQVRGMVVEMRAEAAACTERGIRRVREELETLDEATERTQRVVNEVRDV